MLLLKVLTQDWTPQRLVLEQGLRPWRVCTRFLEFQTGRPVRGCACGELHPEASAHEHELASYFNA